MSGEWKKIFKYEDESGGAKRDEMNGLVDRGKKRKEPDAETEDDDEKPSKTNGAKQSSGRSAASTKSPGKKQLSLDAHIGKKKIRI